MPILTLKTIKDQDLGVVLPKEMLSEMNVSEGHEIVATKVEGGYLLCSKSSETRRQVEMGRKILSDYSSTFRDLAK